MAPPRSVSSLPGFDSLVDGAWIEPRLEAPGVRVLDASWYLPDAGRNPQAEFAAAHVPGAQRFDIDRIADRLTPLPHMLPGADAFAAAVGAMGIGNDDRVVVYDGAGLMSAARAWWMFRVFGHAAVAVLDGGLPKWRAEGRMIETAVRAPAPRRFVASFDKARVRDLRAMRANLETAAEQVIDARGPGRFAGAEPEPRAGLRGGHIPGSRNLPYPALLDPEEGTVLPKARLRAAFAGAGVDLGAPVVTTCGSGVTAAIVALALEVLGHDAVALYDGSWAEWGGRDDTPVDA